MSKAYLRASLALWRRQLKWRRARLAVAHRNHDALLSRKWDGLVYRAQAMIADRQRELAAKTRKPTGRAKAVAWAQAHVGISERPSGSNGNPANISKWQASFGFGRCPWCGVALGMALRAGGVKGVTSRIASVAAIEDDARAGRAPFRSWSHGEGVLRGDAVVIGGRGVHVELVVKRHADGSCSTVGGNTSVGFGGSQSNGGCMAARRRSRGEIHGYALVAYDA